MKKRTIAVLLTMAMAVTMMAGCGSKSDSKTAEDVYKRQHVCTTKIFIVI